MKPIDETHLAGIGTRFSVQTLSGERLIFVVHDGGRVELYHAPKGEAEPVPVAILNEEEARHVAAIISRTIYRPEAMERLSRSGVGIIWHELLSGAHAVGKAARDLRISERTGVSVVSVVRKGGDQRVPLDGGYIFQEGDQVALAGSGKEIQAARDLLDRGIG